MEASGTTVRPELSGTTAFAHRISMRLRQFNINMTKPAIIGGQENCKIKEKSFCLLSEQEASAFHFVLGPANFVVSPGCSAACLQSRYSSSTWPAQGLQLLIAKNRGGGLILLHGASSFCQGKDLTPFTLPRSDRDWSHGMESLECRADLLSRVGSVIRGDVRQVPLS